MLDGKGKQMKFLIADDHPLFREALQGILQQLDAEAQCLEAGNCAEVYALIEQHPDLDLLLLDIVMPCGEEKVIDVLPRLAEQYPELPVVMLSASEDPCDIWQALDYGAMGYIPKSLPVRVMVSALQLVLAGGVYVPPHLVSSSMRPESRGYETKKSTHSGAAPLTPRQWEVARLLREGKSNKEIGRILGLSPETVKVHLAAIFRTLGVNNRTRAVMELERLKLED